jgi:hypothetical protein
MRRLWHDYSLSITLGGLFLSAWVLQTVTGWVEFRAQQQALGATAELFGGDGYVWQWARTTMENWQSEFLQLLTFVVLTSFLIHRGSHESKDGDEEFRAQLTRIEHRLASLTAESPSVRGYSVVQPSQASEVEQSREKPIPVPKRG